MLSISVMKPGQDSMDGQDEEYSEEEIKCCADTVLEAEEVKQDPVKWPLVQEELAKRKKALEAVTGLDAIKAKVKSKLKSMPAKDTGQAY